jgi:hypothetical protein
VLRRAFVDERVHSAIAPRRPLTLAKIFDEGLQVLGIDAGAISVDDYPLRAVSLWRCIRSFPISMASRIDHATTMARFASACSIARTHQNWWRMVRRDLTRPPRASTSS